MNTNYMRKTKQNIMYWYRQYKYIHVGTCDLHVVRSVNILSHVHCTVQLESMTYKIVT